MSRPSSRGRGGRLALVALALAGLAGVGGCGTGPGSAEAAATAERFAQQAAGAPEQACAMLSEQTRDDLEKSEQAPCPEALPKVQLPPASARRVVDVYEQHARVVLADDVVFLARFDDGWRVTAAGCEPQPEDKPYDCELGG